MISLQPTTWFEKAPSACEGMRVCLDIDNYQPYQLSGSAKRTGAGKSLPMLREADFCRRRSRVPVKAGPDREENFRSSDEGGFTIGVPMHPMPLRRGL
jgi:hypothetical protein